MPRLASWIRGKDEKWFRPFFDRHPDIQVDNAARAPVSPFEMEGLLLTGGPDISEDFLQQPVPDPAVLEKDADPRRDQWEFLAAKEAVERGVPIFGICKGLQVLNVALGGTLLLDIPGHNEPPQRDHDVQPLRYANGAAHQFDKVNSSHHQAIDRLADGWEVEAWCATDDIIEQIRMRDYPFALAVQFHPERGGDRYAPLFADFFTQVREHVTQSSRS